MKNIWRTGIIFSAISFLTNVIYYLFQMIISRQFPKDSGEYGLMNNTLTFATYLGLPLAIATQAVTHYIARFHFSGDDSRLHGLLAGCRKFLFHMTIAGSVMAVILVKPLGAFFHIPRVSLTVIALVCVLGGLWTSYITALCQGLGWFKRLALIGLLSAIIRVVFGGISTRFWPIAEWAVMASVVMLASNLILFLWKDQFPRRRDGEVTSPWTAEFTQFLIVSAACIMGSNFFSQGDTLAAQRSFSEVDRDVYSAAEKLAVALTTGLGPLLTVLFTHRSSRSHGDELSEQLKLLGLYALGLVAGAACLYGLRHFCLHLLNPNTPKAADMIGRLSVAMVFIGLLQALALWSLASRWIKISILYGVLGLIYWLVLLIFGKTPADLLYLMPIVSGAAFVVVFLVWLVAMRLHKIRMPDET